MADSVQVNYEAIELGYSLSVFTNRGDYTRTIAYEEDLYDEPFRTAMEYWGDRGECVFRGFLLIHEGVMILQEQDDENDNQKTTDLRFDIMKKELPNGRKTEPDEIDLRSILKNSHNTVEQSSERHKTGHRQKLNCSTSKGLKQTNRRRYAVDDKVHVPLCDPESDLTGTEDESDVLRPRPRQLNIQKTHQLGSDSDSCRSCKVNIQDSSMELNDNEYPLLSVSKARWKSAEAKFKEAQLLLRERAHSGRGSKLKEIDFYRLSIVSTILNCIDNPTLGVNECKRLVTHLNSLELTQGVLTRALETPRGWKQRLTKRLHGRKWDKMLSLVHFTNYMAWKWFALTGVQEGPGQTMNIPVIDTTHGPVHPTDDWSVRDKCQTCVEFVGKIPHACAIASNSKDQLVMIDSRNYITVYTIEGKVVLAFKASTSRHPHARCIIGIDDDDNMYLGSARTTLCDTKHPLSIFNSTGTLLSEPELRGVRRGGCHLHAVTKSGVILTLAVGTHMGNMVTLQHRDSKAKTSFPVREIALPRVFNASNDNIVIGGNDASKDFAFQVFDHSGQQLYFVKPELNFQYCQMDPWTGNLVLVTTSTLRDYRYCLCNTVVLTGEVCILATNGQTIQSGVNLRWPFRKVAGVTMMKSGLVAVVTIDEPYYAIHVI